MERTRTPRRFSLLGAALTVLVILLAIYLPLKSKSIRSERAAERPAAGTSLSVFFTSRLGGYREPCG